MRRSVRHLGVRAVLCLALPLVTSQPARADKTFPELINQWSLLSLQGRGCPVQGLRLSAGHVTLVLANGNAAPVVAGDEVVGIFFRGQGTLEYLSADPVEFPIVT